MYLFTVLFEMNLTLSSNTLSLIMKGLLIVLPYGITRNEIKTKFNITYGECEYKNSVHRYVHGHSVRTVSSD